MKIECRQREASIFDLVSQDQLCCTLQKGWWGQKRAETAVLFLDLIQSCKNLEASLKKTLGRTSYRSGIYVCAKFGGSLYDAVGGVDDTKFLATSA